MNIKKLYRDASALAAIQLDRPISPQEVARIEACLMQARTAQYATDPANYHALKILAEIIPTLVNAPSNPVEPMTAITESLDEATRNIAKAFAPAKDETKADK